MQENGIGARLIPKPSIQEKSERKGKFLKEKKQVTTLNPTITSSKNRWTEKQEQKLERNLLLMIESGMVCSESHRLRLVRVITDVAGYRGTRTGSK